MSDSGEILTNLKAVQLGGKKAIKITEWKRNLNKTARNSGKSYVSTSKKLISGKEFTRVTTCCLKKCCEKVTQEQQIDMFTKFWDSSNKEVQDTFLSTCMKTQSLKTVATQPKKERLRSWCYSLRVDNGHELVVCQKLLMKLFNVSVKRIRIVQDKIINHNGSFSDQRGTHCNRPYKFESSVWDLLIEHINSIPHKKSHYCQEKSNLNYFDDPCLNVKTLHDMFSQFYKEKTGKNLIMKYKTYFKFFKQQCNFSFRHPKTDVCDYCTECQMKLNVNPEDECKLNFMVHKKKMKAYSKTKNEILENCKTDLTTLVIEFDYAQNLPLPKLNVTSQFYKRLLWLYTFNVHIHNDNTSYMYTFMETEGKKDANSVASFLYDCLKKKLVEFPRVKKIVFLSDGAGGQNKNKTIVSFGCWFAKVYNVDITHMFPVRGHSFSQCDRNFGIFKTLLKKKEVITTVKPYLESMVLARSSNPFIVTHDKTLLKDWNSAFNTLACLPPVCKGRKFKIQSYVQMKYMENGTLLASTTYCANFIPFKIWKTSTNSETLNNVQQTLKPPSPPMMNVAKIRDVRDLYRFIDGDGVAYIEMLFENLTVEETPPTNEEISDEEF